MRKNEQRALLAAMGVMAFATLALASGPRWASSASVLLAGLCAVPLVNSRRVIGGRPALLLLISIPLVASAFQLLPLPAGLVSVLSPTTYDLAVLNAKTYGHEMPSLLPLSRDWPATLVEFGKFCGYAAFAVVCLRLCSSSRARSWLLSSIAVVGGVVAIIALAHRGLGMTSLFGLYRPEAPYPQAISPFFNPNHLAGYLAMVVPVCIGLALRKRSPFFVVLALLCAGTSIQAVSRGGLIALVAGCGVLAVLVLFRKEQGAQRAPVPTAAIAAAAVLLLAGAIFALQSTAATQLLRFDFGEEILGGKFLAWRLSDELIWSSPWVGIGRGAFENSFTPLQPGTGATFSHVENEYLQTVIDWGIPVGLAIAAALVLFLRQGWKGAKRGPLEMGAAAALVALLTHSIVDFHLFLPGVALPAIALAAALAPARLIVEKDRGTLQRVRLLRMAGSAAVVLVAALSASALGAGLSEELEAQPALRKGSVAKPGMVLQAASEVSRRHPSSYLLAARVSKKLWEQQDSRAFGALALALELNPRHWGLRVLAAKILASSQSPRQAIAEYRHAMAITGPSVTIFKEMVKDFPDASDLATAVPMDSPRLAGYVDALLQIGRSDAAAMVAKQAVAMRPQPFELYRKGIEAALEQKELDWALVESRKAFERVGSAESLLLHIAALQAAGRNEEALELLDKEVDPTERDNSKVLKVYAELQLAAGQLEAAKTSAEELLRRASRRSDDRRIAHEILATIESQKGNHHRAAWHRDQAQSSGSR